MPRLTAASNSPIDVTVTDDLADPPTSAVIAATGESEKFPTGSLATNASMSPPPNVVCTASAECGKSAESEC